MASTSAALVRCAAGSVAACVWSAAARCAALEAESERSLAAQHELEAADSLDFASYLAAYYDQYAAL